MKFYNTIIYLYMCAQCVTPSITISTCKFVLYQKGKVVCFATRFQKMFIISNHGQRIKLKKTRFRWSHFIFVTYTNTDIYDILEKHMQNNNYWKILLIIFSKKNNS